LIPLIALATKETEAIRLMRGDEITDACVVRQKKAYPVYDETYLDNLRMIRLELQTRFPSLHLVGRIGMHKYNNQDHAMMTGMPTAENVLAGRTLFDVWQVNEDAEYGEAGFSGAREALQSTRLVPKKWPEDVSATSHATTPLLRECQSKAALLPERPGSRKMAHVFSAEPPLWGDCPSELIAVKGATVFRSCSLRRWRCFIRSWRWRGWPSGRASAVWRTSAGFGSARHRWRSIGMGGRARPALC
jgi:hypothetical protein